MSIAWSEFSPAGAILQNRHEFLNICSHLQENSFKSVSYFFKRTSSTQVNIGIGKNPPKMERILAYSRSVFSIWNFVLGAKQTNFRSHANYFQTNFVQRERKKKFILTSRRYSWGCSWSSSASFSRRTHLGTAWRTSACGLEETENYIMCIS